MRAVVVGLGVQGGKRIAIAGDEVVARVDPVDPTAEYQAIDQVPLNLFEAAYVCTPDQAKIRILAYLLSRGKHVLVEKPLLVEDERQILRLDEIARANGVACYTAYNHRFEPHLIRLKRLLEERIIGDVYLARFFYGNGTARNVRNSPWRDQGLGVLSDLGSHLLDLVLFFFGPSVGPFEPWAFNRFENRAFDHVLFGSSGAPAFELEVALVSWRNTFSIDIFGELGSVHVHGLCKWGPSTLTVRRRVFPSGKPEEESQTIERDDATWAAEYQYFKELCRTGGTNLGNDLWINGMLNRIARRLGQHLAEGIRTPTTSQGSMA